MFKKIFTVLATSGVVAASGLLAISPASATPPSCSGFFSGVAGATTCEVPQGITTLYVQAGGAGGGYGYGGTGTSNGGGGGGVMASVSVTPGEILNIEVGEPGQSSDTAMRGGGGGGWTALLRGTTPLVIAGGGGGGGTVSSASAGITDTFSGGKGSGSGSTLSALNGTAGSPVTFYTPTSTPLSCSGGGATTATGGARCQAAGRASFAGTQYVGGFGADLAARNGERAVGANRWQRGTIGGYDGNGASGGAGYYGGGGGGVSQNATSLVYYGGSAGGGSSYVADMTGFMGAQAGTNGGIYSSSTLATGGLISLGSVPFAPTINSGTAGDTTASIAFTAPSNTGGPSISNYEYSLDDGSSWTAANPAVTSGPISLTGLSNGTTYAVRVRAVNSYGGGLASNAVTVTPFAPSLAPITPGSNPNLPATGVPLGQAVLLVDGQLTVVSVAPNAGSNPTGLNVSGTGFTMALKGLNATGQPLGLTSDGALILENDRTAFVEGTGFKPNSTVDVYLFSTPRLLGTVPTDANGNFSGSVPVPLDIAAGRHTLQSNGFTASGSVRSLNLGVQLDEKNGTAVLSTTGSHANEAVLWAGGLLAAGLLASVVSMTVRERNRRRYREV